MQSGTTTLCGLDIEVPSTSIAIVMDKLILSLFVVRIRVSIVSSFWEWKCSLFLRLQLSELMDSIMRQETTVNILDVRIPTSSISSIVNYAANGRTNSICLHAIKIIYFLILLIKYFNYSIIQLNWFQANKL